MEPISNLTLIEKELLQIDIIPGEFSNPEDLLFDWSILSYEGKVMTV